MVKLCLLTLQVLHRLTLLTSNTIVRARFLSSSLPRKGAEETMKCVINTNQIKSYMYIWPYYCIKNLYYKQKILSLRCSWVVNF